MTKEDVNMIYNMRRFAISIALCPHDADDILQDVAISVMRNYDRFKDFTTKGKEQYLFTMVRNRFVDTKRRLAKKRRDEVYLIEKYQRPEALAKMELKDVLKKASLNEKCDIQILHACGYSFKEIAKLTKTNINTLLPHAHQARIYLKKTS